MKWWPVVKRPTKPGFYWYNNCWKTKKGIEYHPNPTIVEVSSCPVTGELQVVDLDDTYDLSGFPGRWAGPIEPPTEE